MALQQGIVISGMGFATILGTTRAEVWSNLLAGVARFSAPRDCADADPCGLVGVVADDVVNRLLPAEKFRRLPHATRLAIAAVSECLRDLPLKDIPKDMLEARVGVFLGTDRGPLEPVENISMRLVEGNPKGVNPLHFQETVYNAPLGHISVHYGFRGPCVAFSNGSTSGLTAMEMAMRLLAKGEIDLALVGGVEAVTPIHCQGMRDLNLLSRGTPQVKPFGEARDGTIPSEGAAFVALEREDMNRARGGKRYARLAGIGSACDAFSFFGNSEDGRGFRFAMENSLDAGGLSAADVDLILAAASGQVQQDRAEAAGIGSLWGKDRGMPVTALKAMLGDAGAVSALMACVVGCEILAQATVPATLPHAPVHPLLDVNLVQAPLRMDVGTLLINEASWGGLNSSVILQKV